MESAHDSSEQLNIIYQDKLIVAVHKPAGLLVHKSPIDKHETRFAMKIVRDQIGQWVYPVHRLDKPTSGLLLFALHPDIASQVGRYFEERLIKKTYHAIVRGHCEKAGKINHPLKEIAAFKHEQESLNEKQPQEAQTYFENIHYYELPFSDGRFPTSRYSFIRLSPTTGRKHQIRRHLKHISHPIIGDVKYGKGSHNRLFQEKLLSHRLLLAATELSFPHPETNELVQLACPIEETFQDTLNRLKQYKTS
ncbi:MAG: pseudouridine synthase [Oleiphilus sp.]